MFLTITNSQMYYVNIDKPLEIHVHQNSQDSAFGTNKFQVALCLNKRGGHFLC